MHLKRQKKCALSLFLRRYIHMHHFMWKTCQNLTVILSELVLVLPLFVGKEGCFSPLIQINILQLRSFNHHLDMKVSCHIINIFFFFILHLKNFMLLQEELEFKCVLHCSCFGTNSQGMSLSFIYF